MTGNEAILLFPEEFRNNILENNKLQGLEEHLNAEYSTKEEFIFTAFSWKKSKEGEKFWAKFARDNCDSINIFKLALQVY